MGITADSLCAGDTVRFADGDFILTSTTAGESVMFMGTTANTVILTWDDGTSGTFYAYDLFSLVSTRNAAQF